MRDTQPFKAFRFVDEATQAYADNGHVPKPKSRQCKVNLVTGSGSPSATELHHLLRSRLRLAALVTSAAFAIFFIRNLFDTTETTMATPTGLALQAAVMAVSIVLAALLWSRKPFCLFSLRVIEMALFLGPFLYITWGQFHSLCLGCHILPLAKEGNEGKVIRLAAGMISVRWFCLLMIYGTFIPNTWKRCAIVVGVMAGWPILLNLGMGLFDPNLQPYLGVLVLDTSLTMGLGAAIAIFGTYKISSLREEAVEARKLGQYFLKRRLGAGGMGEVYLAEHLLLRRPCAVKLIRPEQAGDPANLTRFEREVRSMATLTHWNSVEVFDYGRTEDGTFYYVMEYLPGLSLQEMVEKFGPLPPGRAVHLLRQVCRALREAHGIGLIHRDIKPSNIIVCQRGATPDVAKLLDFGLVQSSVWDDNAEKLTVLGTIVGSPPFMSPEQAAGASHIDARSDIYSLGGVAYFLLTGQSPFVRDTAMKMLMAHAYDKVIDPNTLRADIPTDLQEVVLKCLEKKMEDRYQDAESLEKALGQCAVASEWTEDQAAEWWKESMTSKDQQLQEETPMLVGATAN